jgi:myo-inositol-1(or 4)-monophosphatase
LGGDVTELDALLAIAVEAVERASALVRSREPGVLTSKGDRDMASEVDLAVEDEIRAFLAARTPEIGFLGEEGGRASDGTGGLVWVLDPIDGTVNFVHGLPLVAVSLGLLAGDAAIVGVIELPLLGTRYTATAGGGAMRDGEAITGSRCEDLEDALVAIGDYAVGPDAESRNERRLALTGLLARHVQRIRLFGTAATDLVWAAEGSVDAVVLTGNKPWDTAAGVLIAREAGMAVVDLDGSTHTVDSEGVIAVAKPLLPSLLGLVGDALRP